MNRSHLWLGFSRRLQHKGLAPGETEKLISVGKSRGEAIVHPTGTDHLSGPGEWGGRWWSPSTGGGLLGSEEVS